MSFKISFKDSNNCFYTWIPLLRLATWRCDVRCSTASSSMVRRCRSLPSTLAARNVSLYCGNPTSSNHRNTHAVSSSPAGIRCGSRVATVLCCDNRARCSFFRWIGFCRTYSCTDKVSLSNQPLTFNACSYQKSVPMHALAQQAQLGPPVRNTVSEMR